MKSSAALEQAFKDLEGITAKAFRKRTMGIDDEERKAEEASPSDVENPSSENEMPGEEEKPFGKEALAKLLAILKE